MEVIDNIRENLCLPKKKDLYKEIVKYIIHIETIISNEYNLLDSIYSFYEKIPKIFISKMDRNLTREEREFRNSLRQNIHEKSVLDGVKKVDSRIITMLHSIEEENIEDLQEIVINYQVGFSSSRFSEELKEFSHEWEDLNVGKNDRGADETSQFLRYYQIMVAVGLSDEKAKYVAGRFTSFSRKKLAKTTKETVENLDRLNRYSADKLGAANELPFMKDKLMKEYADVLDNPEIRDDFLKLFTGQIRERIEQAKTITENKRIADAVRADPELLAKIERLQGNQNA